MSEVPEDVKALKKASGEPSRGRDISREAFDFGQGSIESDFVLPSFSVAAGGKYTTLEMCVVNRTSVRLAAGLPIY